jgi:superfamily II DNA/RNA helicase
MVFCAGVAHARALACMLEEQGINAAAVPGHNKKADERQETLRRFTEGRYT